ncbi:MAG: hypothetical protein RL885_01600 [Planctomycetota bacterium]
MTQSSGSGQDAVSVKTIGDATEGAEFCVLVSGPPNAQLQISVLMTAPGQSDNEIKEPVSAGEYCFDIPAGYGGGSMLISATLLPKSEPPVRSPSKTVLIGTS